MARAAKPGELIGIQYLRGLAALLVVVHHIIECQYNFAGARMIPREIVLVGSVGVDLFFVISGIIMMVSSFPRDRRPLRPLEFLKRRGQRIYPLYWCFAALILLIGAVGVSSGEHRTVDDLIRSLLLLPSKVGLLSYAWTLQDEVYFYAAFAVGCLVPGLGGRLLRGAKGEDKDEDR